MRRACPGGFIRLTMEQFVQVKDIAGISRLRGPWLDIKKCIDWGFPMAEGSVAHG